MGSTPSTSSSKTFESWTLAAVNATASGTGTVNSAGANGKYEALGGLLAAARSRAPHGRGFLTCPMLTAR